ncbi:MAG: flagellar export chaperone FlgN [Huintestinicola sp.]
MNYPELLKFFEEYNAHYRSFLKFEYAKMDMINKDDIEKLTDSLSAEQALIMKTNTLETRRLKLFGADAGKTFPQIIEEAPEEYKEPLNEKYTELSQLVSKIKEINDTANIIVTERLKRIRSRVGELDTYNGHGNVRKDGVTGSALSKSV